MHGESSYGFTSSVTSVAQRVAARHLQASQVKVEVDLEETLEARRKSPSFPEIIVGTFESTITLYRIFDDAELVRVLSTGKITGGTYSLKAERSYGASWGANISDVISWGNKLRGKRLGDSLFLARLDATGFKFLHLDLDVSIDPQGSPKQVIQVDRSRISTSLGASVAGVDLGDVELFTVDPNGQMSKITPSEAKELVSNRPKHEVELRRLAPHFYQGAILGVDVRVFQPYGDDGYTTWSVKTNDDREFVLGADTVYKAIDEARVAILENPEHPSLMDLTVSGRRGRKKKAPPESPRVIIQASWKL